MRIATALMILVCASSAEGQISKAKGVVPGQKRVRVALDVNAPAGLDISRALASAISTWNSVLPKDIRLARGNLGAPPPGEAVFVVSFESNPTVFKGYGGADEYGFTGSVVDAAKNTLVTVIILNDTPVFNQTEGFATNGTAGKIDLEIVVLHELGHALGLEHANARGVPPLMAKAIPPNGPSFDPTQNRALAPQDLQLLTDALAERDKHDFTGRWTGTLSGDSRTITIADGDLVVELEKGDLQVTYKKNSVLKAPATAALDLTTIKLEDKDAGNTLEWIELTKQPTGELGVKVSVNPGLKALTLTGTLKK